MREENPLPNRRHVLVTVPFGEPHMKRLRKAAESAATITQVSSPTNDVLRNLLADADAVIGQPAPKLLTGLSRLRWVQMTWAGSDLYTQGPIAFPQGVRLTNVAGAAFGHIISQYVVGQVLSFAQNLPAYTRQQERSEWKPAGPVMTLEGATALVFGAGDIGTRTAERLAAFSCHCLGVRRNTSQPRQPFERLVTLPQAEALLPTVDIVVCCLPSTPKTRGYLNERRLRLMKPGSILVNVGRGDFIDCDALACVLSEGLLRGAALDVTNPEPLPADHPLWHEPRCSITPHQAGVSFGACAATEERICTICCDNLRRWLAGEPLTHVVI